MQKRMKSAHPRTPGGRQPVPKGSKSQVPWSGYSKFMPVRPPKAPADTLKKENKEDGRIGLPVAAFSKLAK